MSFVMAFAKGRCSFCHLTFCGTFGSNDLVVVYGMEDFETAVTNVRDGNPNYLILATH